jgi:hypothetical protein
MQLKILMPEDLPGNGFSGKSPILKDVVESTCISPGQDEHKKPKNQWVSLAMTAEATSIQVEKVTPGLLRI